MIHGGPESALYRSIDAGKTWTQVRGGFPTGDLGRIGLNQAPTNPSIIYAQVEGPEGRGGTYRSTDNGVTWEKRGSYDEQGQYYSKVQVDPANSDRIYIMNMNIMVSDDGGRTVTALGTRNKHVDNHDIWVDPEEQQSLPGGLRRRPLRILRPRRHLELQGEPAHRPDVRRGGQRGRAVLLRLRRHAGQQQLRLSGARTSSPI